MSEKSVVFAASRRLRFRKIRVPTKATFVYHSDFRSAFIYRRSPSGAVTAHDLDLALAVALFVLFVKAQERQKEKRREDECEDDVRQPQQRGLMLLAVVGGRVNLAMVAVVLGSGSRDGGELDPRHRRRGFSGQEPQGGLFWRHLFTDAALISDMHDTSIRLQAEITQPRQLYMQCDSQGGHILRQAPDATGN